MSTIYFKLLSENAIEPTRKTKHSAGFDLYAAEDITVGSDSTVLSESGTTLVPTDIAIAIPPGYYGRIAIRSGHALNHNLAISAGVIDADYRGPIGVLVFNTARQRYYKIKKGERFAQIIIEKINTSGATVTDVLPDPDSTRNGGFGSTGNM